jgi:O-antigen/teichoic acid export membrane protein
MTTKVVKGSLWTLAGQVAPMFFSLLTTPLVIRLLGAEGYGALILVGLIPAYLGFADFGMSMASTKFASEAYAAGDLEKEARIVRTAALIALCSSLPFAIVLFASSSWLVILFNVPGNLQPEAALALKIASVTFVVNFLTLIFNTPQLTRLRMDVNTFVTSGFRILGLIATPIVLYLGLGIVGAVAVLLVASLLTLAGHLYASRRLTPHLFGRSFERPSVTLMLKFGGALVGAGIAGLILANIEKGILSRIASVKELAFYSVAFTVASMLTIFSSAISQSLLPAFSQLQNSDDLGRLNDLFSRVIRINLIWFMPAMVCLSIGARPFFTLWAGEEFGRESTVPFYILLCGLALHILTYPPYTLIIASGRTDLLARIYWLELFPYLTIASVLISYFGSVGAAAAWTVRIITDNIILFVSARRIGGVSFPARQAGRVLASSLILLLPILMNYYFGYINLVTIIVAAVSLMFYFFLIWKVTLETDELNWLKRKLNIYIRLPA